MTARDAARPQIAEAGAISASLRRTCRGHAPRRVALHLNELIAFICLKHHALTFFDAEQPVFK